jgi:hypothetical protein
MSSRLTRKNLDFFYLGCSKEFNPHHLSDSWQLLCILQHLNFMCQKSVDEKRFWKTKAVLHQVFVFLWDTFFKEYWKVTNKANCHLHRMLPQEPVTQGFDQWPTPVNMYYTPWATFLEDNILPFFLGFKGTFHICIRFSTSLLLHISMKYAKIFTLKVYTERETQTNIILEGLRFCCFKEKNGLL